MSRRRLVTLLAVPALLAGLAGPAGASGGAPPERPDTRSVMFVGNNWEGTATVIDATTFEVLTEIDVLPDREERMAEITSSPDRLAFFLAIRELVGEGNDQFVDDVFTDHAGTEIYVSRPSFADVVAVDLETGEIRWRFPMDGYRSDHMAISPDGTRLLVSDSTANVVHEIELATGRESGRFASGDSPHENVYSPDARRVFHASIGRVYTPTDRAELGLARDTSKGERVFQIVDADTLEILERWDIGAELAEYGRDDMSAAVRPMAITPDQRTAYFQVSFHHGLVEFDLEAGDVTDVIDLPRTEASEGLQREQYLLDSAHHGLALDPSGTKLCVAGTMDDYAAIVPRDTFEANLVSRGSKPYWSTTGPTGEHCWVSYSGDDEVAVLDYASEQELARIPVGDHPQRVRAGAYAERFLPAAAGSSTPSAPAGDPGGAPAAPATDTSGLPATGGGLAAGGLAVLALASLGSRRRR